MLRLRRNIALALVVALDAAFGFSNEGWGHDLHAPKAEWSLWRPNMAFVGLVSGAAVIGAIGPTRVGTR